MWREHPLWVTASILLPWLVALAGILVLAQAGYLDTPTALGCAAAALVVAALASAIAQRAAVRAARRAVAALGPGADGERRRRSVGGMRGAAARLDRAWRDHLAASVARLAAAEAIIASAPDPLILIDRQRRVVRANLASAGFVGHSAEPRDLAAALRNPELLAAVDAVLAGEAPRNVVFTLSVPVARVLRAHVARIDGPALDGAAAILTLHDVTELKRTEQMRADFVANAGHELKTPLAALIGFIETLLGPARDDPAARERFLGIMGEQARRMARLVDDLLSLSRIEMNEHVAPTGRVALAAVIDEVARGLELRAAERDIRIERALPDDLPEVLGERDELAQIVQNLLDNAVKYGRPHSTVTVSGAVAAGSVAVAVTDQGEGIRSEHLPRLTERFYRIDTARSRELGGTGLGLAVVKHILNRHRGRLDIVSRLGEGSTFTVWLPAAEGENNRQAAD
jgi:two-component system, OmpR family, phosphate regulon sensor histidine kinase PhoR